MALDIEVKGSDGETVAHTAVEYGTHSLLIEFIKSAGCAEKLPMIMRMADFYRDCEFTPQDAVYLIDEIKTLEKLIRGNHFLVEEHVKKTLTWFEKLYQGINLLHVKEKHEKDSIQQSKDAVKAEKDVLLQSGDVMVQPLVKSLFLFLEELKRICDVAIQTNEFIRCAAD
jgi:hypothetical protein